MAQRCWFTYVGDYAMTPIFAALQSFFAVGWFCAENPAKKFIHFNFEGKHGVWPCYAQALEVQMLFVFYSVWPQAVPEAQRPAVMELLTRLNYGLATGNFELDLDDGEVRLKTSIDVDGTDLTLTLIKPVVFANLALMDKYWPALAAVLAHQATPTEAMAQIEAHP